MNKEIQPPPRPYTEYNIFFQIEREHILQDMGVIPSLTANKIFSTSDPTYDGPDLPPRYHGLILPSDWYVPGKGRRKKRQHVATHGKISFTELSKSVAATWRNIDEKTKLFCSQLAAVGLKKYKRELRLHKVRMHEELEARWAEAQSQNQSALKTIGYDVTTTKAEECPSSTLATSVAAPATAGLAGESTFYSKWNEMIGNHAAVAREANSSWSAAATTGASHNLHQASSSTSHSSASLNSNPIGSSWPKIDAERNAPFSFTNANHKNENFTQNTLVLEHQPAQQPTSFGDEGKIQKTPEDHDVTIKNHPATHSGLKDPPESYNLKQNDHRGVHTSSHQHHHHQATVAKGTNPHPTLAMMSHSQAPNSTHHPSHHNQHHHRHHHKPQTNKGGVASAASSEDTRLSQSCPGDVDLHDSEIIAMYTKQYMRSNSS